MATGRIIAGKYRLVRELGRGGMGSVWVAEHTTLGMRVAIKLIDRSYPSADLRRRFEQEARAAASLQSPHVVQVFDYGVDGITPYLVMELLDGRSLAQRLHDEVLLTPAATFTVVSHVVHAISRAHEVGFVHRDLKPDNVFLVDTADHLLVKVLDFGVAKSLVGSNAELTRAGALMGTPAYASPEQIEGKPIDARSDLWGLGVITFQCLTGCLPFTRPTLPALLNAICREPLVVPSQVAEVPQGFDEWFARALERDPERRFQTAQEFRDTLRPLIGPGANRPSVGPLHDTTRWPTSTLHVPTFTSVDDPSVRPRLPSAIPAGIDGKRDLQHAAILRDTSRAGALLLTRHAFRLGQALELSLQLDSAEEGVLVSARVTEVLSQEEGMWKHRVSVRFAEPLSDDLLTRLENKVRARQADREQP